MNFNKSNKISLNINTIKSRNRNTQIIKNNTHSNEGNNIKNLKNIIPTLNFSKILNKKKELNSVKEKFYEDFHMKTLPNFEYEADFIEENPQEENKFFKDDYNFANKEEKFEKKKKKRSFMIPLVIEYMYLVLRA